MHAPARGTVLEHDWAKVFEFASALRASLPVMVALAYLVLGTFNLYLFGPIGWPRLCLGLGALALAFVLPLTLSFALTLVLPLAFAFARSFWAEGAFVSALALAPGTVRVGLGNGLPRQ